MYSETLGKLRNARASMLNDRDGGMTSRELSIALTHLETAILWFEKDVANRRAVVNEADE